MGGPGPGSLPRLTVAEHGLSLHQYADDSQVYGSCPTVAISTLSTDISVCVDKIFSSNRLQLNADNAGDVVCVGSRSFLAVPSVAGASIEPVNAVRDLGVFIDSDLGPATDVRKTVSRCFAALRYLRHLRRYVTSDCFRSLVCPLCILGWTTATSYLSVFLHISNDASMPFSTLQLVWYMYSDFVGTTTRHQCPGDITLATSPGTGEFQTCADGISCTFSMAWRRRI